MYESYLSLLIEKWYLKEIIESGIKLIVRIASITETHLNLINISIVLAVLVNEQKVSWI